MARQAPRAPRTHTHEHFNGHPMRNGANGNSNAPARYTAAPCTNQGRWLSAPDWPPSPPPCGAARGAARSRCALSTAAPRAPSSTAAPLCTRTERPERVRSMARAQGASAGGNGGLPSAPVAADPPEEVLAVGALLAAAAPDVAGDPSAAGSDGGGSFGVGIVLGSDVAAASASCARRMKARLAAICSVRCCCSRAYSVQPDGPSGLMPARHPATLSCVCRNAQLARRLRAHTSFLC